MESDRKTAIIAGILLLTAILAGLISVGFLGAMGDPTDLAKVAENNSQALIGVLLLIVMAFACAGIAISLYPVLKKYNELLAIGSVGFRVMECVLFLVAAAGQLSILALSQEFVKAGASDASVYQALSSLLYTASDLTSSVLATLAFCIGALLYYYVFYQSRLIPRWLAGWGIIAIGLYMAFALSYMFNLELPMMIMAVMNLAILVQEFVMGIWLIVKGFNKPATVTRSTIQKQDITAN